MIRLIWLNSQKFTIVTLQVFWPFDKQKNYFNFVNYWKYDSEEKKVVKTAENTSKSRVTKDNNLTPNFYP